ncbi:MAG: hypothetical protein KIT56_06540 [Gammaproteobacteria bacterium]|nr:hypothetical protein [Gammaproteobacteria bacterium]MCW5583523.1 hypothetical protein [Gammaproteobacteria bacterium]
MQRNDLYDPNDIGLFFDGSTYASLVEWDSSWLDSPEKLENLPDLTSDIVPLAGGDVLQQRSLTIEGSVASEASDYHSKPLMSFQPPVPLAGEQKEPLEQCQIKKHACETGADEASAKERQEKRRIANKEYSKRTRERKKQEFETLTDQLRESLATVKKLKNKVRILEKKTEKLKVRSLEEEVKKLKEKAERLKEENSLLKEALKLSQSDRCEKDLLEERPAKKRRQDFTGNNSSTKIVPLVSVTSVQSTLFSQSSGSRSNKDSRQKQSHFVAARRRW